MATENSKKTSEERKKLIKDMREKDREMVKGVFKFYEVPGGTMRFPYKKYKEDSLETFEMVDGNFYTIPFGVAKHLNTAGAYPVHEFRKDEQDKPHIHIGKMVRRFGFHSLEFQDFDKDYITEPASVSRR